MEKVDSGHIKEDVNDISAGNGHLQANISANISTSQISLSREQLSKLNSTSSMSFANNISTEIVDEQQQKIQLTTAAPFCSNMITKYSNNKSMVNMESDGKLSVTYLQPNFFISGSISAGKSVQINAHQT